MPPIQPPLTPIYFSKNSNNLAKSQKVRAEFFLSWEDGLWYLLQAHSIPKDGVVLVPDFFCWDVVANMEAHGLKHTTYSVTKQLQPDRDSFIEALKKHKPAAVIIFHAVGITNSLFKNSRKWLQYLPKNCILIEDCVHRIVDPEKSIFIYKNHYIMDSLRKVVPIQGSWLWAQKSQSRTSAKTMFGSTAGTHWYHLQIMFWWLVMQFFLVLTYYGHNLMVGKVSNYLAEWAMKVGYDIIGDNLEPSKGAKSMAWLWSHLNIPKIKAEKIKQAHLYQRSLALILKKPSADTVFFNFSISEHDFGELRGFPLGIHIFGADEALDHLRERGLITRFELNDSPWSLRHKVIYLPMGLHIKTQDIEWVCRVIEECAS